AGLVDFGSGVSERRADLVDLDLHHGTLLALAGLERALLEPTSDNHPCSTGEALRNILGSLPPDVAPQEQRLTLPPFPALAVVTPRRRGHGEIRDRSTGRSEPQFRVGSQISDDGNGGVTSHSVLLSPPASAGGWS